MKMLKIAALLLLLSLLWACGNGDAGLRGSGTIESVTVRVSAKTAGELLEILVEEGSHVEKGDLMARIDHTRVDIQLRQAQAGVELAEAQLALVLQGARSEDIRQAAEALTQAEDTLRLAQEEFQRMETLFAGGSVTRKQRDEAESRLTGARARSNSAAAALSKLQNLSHFLAVSDDIGGKLSFLFVSVYNLPSNERPFPETARNSQTQFLGAGNWLGKVVFSAQLDRFDR